MKKIITIVILLSSITSVKAQQVFKPVIIDLEVGNSSYTVPSDSILKVESIGYRTSTLPDGNGGKRISINNKPIWIRYNTYRGHKVPFWLPENTVIALPTNSNQYGEYQIYGLLFPK